jgi:hypothetical protein
MSQTRDERFQELALKLVSFECTPEEKAELRRIIDQDPARREELQRLCISVGIARELLPLADALEATEGRMSTGELATFNAALARRREEKRRFTGGPPPSKDGADGGGPKIIEADVVPVKPFNRYKLGFYALCLLILIVGCVVLLKSCGPNKPGAGAGTAAPNAAVEAKPKAPLEERRAPSPAAQSPAPEVSSGRYDLTSQRPEPRPASGSKLGNYAGSQWVQLADGNAKPGSTLFFRSFVGPDPVYPLIEGMVGPNSGVPSKFLLFSRQGNSWDTQSFPDVDSSPQRVIALDASRILVTSSALHREVSLIEKGQSRDILLPAEINCLAAHSDSTGRIFIHDHNGNVFVVTGTSVTRMADTDPANYVQANGNPTSMRRGFVRSIAKADSGDTMGIYFAEPTALGPAALVRFNGNAWELVCSLGQKYPSRAIHFLGRDSMVAALSRQILVVENGSPRSLGLPNEFEADRSAEWTTVRASSATDFIAADNYGAVYRCSEGRFQQSVGPLPALQGGGNSGFRSVMIAPDGVIYAIHALNQWSPSTLYQLVPK